MTGNDRDTPVDMDQALLDPASVFDTPEALLAREKVSKAEKIEILRRWAYDASEAAVAVEESMPRGENDMLHRILAALDRLAGEIDVEQVAPTKQHGIPRAAVKS
jgi:hypothetical protein